MAIQVLSRQVEAGGRSANMPSAHQSKRGMKAQTHEKKTAGKEKVRDVPTHRNEEDSAKTTWFTTVCTSGPFAMCLSRTVRDFACKCAQEVTLKVHIAGVS